MYFYFRARTSAKMSKVTHSDSPHLLVDLCDSGGEEPRGSAVEEPCGSPRASTSAVINLCSPAVASSAKRPRHGSSRVVNISMLDRVGEDRRIRWPPSPRGASAEGASAEGASETFDRWLSATLPSKVSSDVAAWIQICNDGVHSARLAGSQRRPALDLAPYLTELAKVEAIIACTNRVPAQAKRSCVDSVLALAQEQNYTTGKWLLFFPPDEADVAWETIARATKRGELGCSAKIAPVAGLPDGEMAVCCVYVDDFADRAEVRRVLCTLQQLGMAVKSGFKPDVFTYLNIMRNNVWRLEPTIYKVKEVLEWPPVIERAVYKRVCAKSYFPR